MVAAPDVFQTQGQAAHSDHILGALVLTVAIVAVAEVARAARYVNTALALDIIMLPWLLGGGTLAASFIESSSGHHPNFTPLGYIRR